MKIRNRPRLAWLVLLLIAGALALSACATTPLPPLFAVGGPDAARSAEPARFASASQPAPSKVEALSVAASAAAPAAEPAAAAIRETIELTATAAMPVAIRGADAITITAPFTPSVVITPTAAAAPRSTATPTPTRVAPTATRVAPTATRAAPNATRAPARPAATPTPEWPKTLLITAEDIEEGASSVPGLQISGLDVTFGNNTMTMRFDSLRYSFVSMRNVTVEGRFVVNNCDVDFAADRITPRNLATGAIPGFINQSLDQQLGAWCVEALAVQPGQLVATVRPR